MKSKGIVGRLRDQRGVAMVTVLLIGAALTVVTSTATFLTIQEFRAGADDRRSAQALGYAEAGLDRMIQKIKTTPWDNLLLSGCPAEPVVEVQGSVGFGEFTADVTADLGEPDDCTGVVPDPFEPQFIEVRSEGRLSGASRTVRQILRVVNGNFPIGVYAYRNVLVSGGGSDANAFDGISLITQGSVDQREKLAFIGFDPWLTQFDVYGDDYPDVSDTRCAPSKAVCNSTNSLPAAVHAGGDITCGTPNSCSTGPQQVTEHVGSPDAPSYDLACDANNNKGTPGQSAWDGSANGGPITGTCGTTVGEAPTSLFTVDDAKRLAPDPTPDKIDYDALKAAAQADGIYCRLDASSKVVCTRANNDLKITNAEIGALPDDHIVFFDFPKDSGLTVNWQAQAGNCEASRMTLVVVRNGNFAMEGNYSVAGGVIAAEGDVSMKGGALIHGTVISQTLTTKGNSTFKLDECAIKALTAPFINVTPGQWSESDRLDPPPAP